MNVYDYPCPSCHRYSVSNGQCKLCNYSLTDKDLSDAASHDSGDTDPPDHSQRQAELDFGSDSADPAD